VQEVVYFMDKCDVVIVGAGPYGLSAAAHFQQLKGLDIRLFGEPMSFWERYMPKKMLLRSPWAGSHLADPGNHLTLDAYRKLNGNHSLEYPIPVTDFINYGHWFHQQMAMPADRRKVVRTEPAAGGYRLTLEDGEAIHARRVVIAGGIQPFAYRPQIFAHLPASLVTHTSEFRDFAQFRGKEVLVIGGGQSSLETAAFLHEVGSRVEVIIRNPTLHWLGRRKWTHAKAISWMFFGSADVGPAGISLLVQRPNWFRRLPRRIQNRWAQRAIRPAVSHRLEICVRDVPIHTGRFVVQARVEGERVHLRLNDGGERVVDHVVLATGYRVNVALYPFLSSELLDNLERVDGYPLLDAGFESSLPGLHFLGAPAAWSFGPLMRFVAGTEFAAPALCRRILHATKCRQASLPDRDSFAFEPPRAETRPIQAPAGVSYRSEGK
jgi:FAD-dependent urate hydroxylase